MLKIRSLLESLPEIGGDIFLHLIVGVIGLVLWALAIVCHPWKKVYWPDPDQFEED